jgi:hypothetical protein
MPSAHEEMNEKRYLKQGYQEIFGIPGTASHAALQDFANYCHTFDMTARNHDEALIALGLRRAFFHIWQYLKLEPDELTQIYRSHANGLNRNQGDG